MKHRRSPFLRNYEEQIIVLRPIPQNEQDSTEERELTYCDYTYPRRKFEIIVGRADAKKAIILRDRTTFDPSGFAEQDIEYLANITPPIRGLAVGDIVIGLTSCLELVIGGITRVPQMQELELWNRSKTDNAQV